MKFKSCITTVVSALVIMLIAAGCGRKEDRSGEAPKGGAPGQNLTKVRVRLTWLYQASGKSALPALLFHAANDAWPPLLLSPADARVFELSAGMYALVAIALVVSGRVPLGATDPGHGGE